MTRSRIEALPRKSPAEQLRVVNEAELRLAARPAVQPDQRWLDDIRARLPSTWAKVSTVAIALDVSCATVRQLAESQDIIAVDYAARGERAAWNIYVPSVFEFLKKRQGGRGA
jgi:hypothetical protein